MLKDLIIILCLMILATGCNETPTTSELRNGKVYISSNVIGAEILVDDKPTGKVTPDTLTLLALTYKVKVRHTGYFSEEREIKFPNGGFSEEYFELSKNNLKKNVFVEYFFNDNSQLLSKENLIQDENVNIIQYPDPLSNNSVFTNSELAEIEERINNYSAFNLPAIFIDGKKVITKELENQISKQKKKEVKFTITLNDSLLAGNLIKTNVFVDVYDTDQIDFENLSLFIMIYENNLPSKSNTSSDKIDYVFRAFVTPKEGISLSSVNEKGRVRFSVQTISNPLWRKENLFVLAFVQHSSSLEVLQSSQAKVNYEN